MSKSLNRVLNFTALLLALGLAAAPGARASVVNLGQAGQFTLLALGGSIDDSGPIGPQGNPFNINGPVGVVTAGQKFQASGSVRYSGPVYLHSGVGFNSSAPGVPQPTMSNAVDNMLTQAAHDAFAASSFASGLAATATYGTINSDLTISEANNGHYVFNIDTISFSGGKALTLNGTKNSTFLLNVASGITLSPGSILLTGGLSADNVLINYTGTKDVQFSGGGNSSQVFGTILAPNATVGLHPGFVAGAIIANAITMSSGADVVPVPEVTPSSVIFGFLGLIVAVSSRRVLGGRVRAVAKK
jgi:choice-of-anchor A domain-containing protein